MSEQLESRNDVQAVEFIVHHNAPTRSAKIHIVGGCGTQQPPGHVSLLGNSRWSEILNDIDSARAHAARLAEPSRCSFCFEKRGGWMRDLL